MINSRNYLKGHNNYRRMLSSTLTRKSVYRLRVVKMEKSMVKSPFFIKNFKIVNNKKISRLCINNTKVIYGPSHDKRPFCSYSYCFREVGTTYKYNNTPLSVKRSYLIYNILILVCIRFTINTHYFITLEFSWCVRT